MLGSLKCIWDCHRRDVNSEFAEYANRPVHMKVAGKQDLFACHTLDQARGLNSVFARAIRSPLGNYCFAWNPVGY